MRCGPLILIALCGWTLAGPVGAAPLPELAKDKEEKPAVQASTTATSPDGRLLATAEDKVIKILDAQTQQVRVTIAGHTAKITAVAFAPDGKLLASGSEDKTVRFYDAATGQAVRTFKGNVGVAAIAFSADGRTFTVTGSDQSTVRWEVATGKMLEK